ncbi:ATP-binding cassette domain-containing protein [Candidatus Contendibacter odensensis]|uniref:ATP-binding cassette domain-containing protein n=1 Tax=Candidatus Contendibacter odensensis TaxID=1400860 RepID=UPI0004BBBF04|nr:ABC transporter ATP-binding protein [Candidatus Contendobacter odensis]
MEMEPLIQVARLGKDYPLVGGGVTPVLRDIDLSIAPGEFVAIMGPSGSGKSTFMNILGCLDTPSVGVYHLAGQSVATLDSDRLAELRNRHIGFVFQGFNLLQRSSIVDNVGLPLLYAGVGKAERRRQAQSLLEQVGLGHRADARPNQLSGGQQQRVAIARALANQPPLILADEPTGNLDTQTSTEIMTLFRRLNAEQGITLILVTHEPDIARYARRLVRFKDGHIVHDGEVRL